MNKNIKIFICCTEQSGENIAYNICKRLEKYNYQIDGVGGQLSQKYFTKKFFDISIFKSLGFIEIILSIPKFIKIINFLLLKILKYNYDLVILIDSPDFNYQLAKKLKKNNFNKIRLRAHNLLSIKPGYKIIVDEYKKLQKEKKILKRNKDLFLKFKFKTRDFRSKILKFKYGNIKF